ALAEEVGMSRYQLLRAFKDHYGLPPYAYLMDEKIKRAKVMLKSGEDIVDVANNLGFSDQAHFQRHFKKKLAVTPKFYQSHFVE
ncbi:helix-turn-helix transcriptional regulator, partial [Vibrio coralliilyticus]